MALSQIDFGFLSVPDVQPFDSSEQDAMDHNAFSRCNSSDSQKSAKLDIFVPVNYISPEVCALLAAAEASAAALHVDAFGESVMNQDIHGAEWIQASAVDVEYDPERVLPSMVPPKRFYRTFWRSVSLRLLDRCDCMTRLSAKSAQYVKDC